MIVPGPSKELLAPHRAPAHADCLPTLTDCTVLLRRPQSPSGSVKFGSNGEFACPGFTDFDIRDLALYYRRGTADAGNSGRAIRTAVIGHLAAMG